MSDHKYKTVLECAKEIETILVDMGAEGKGLHAKASSIKSLLDESTVKSIRFIATIRNKFIHNSKFDLTDDLLESFETESEKVISSLTLHSPSSSSNHDSEFKHIVGVQRIPRTITKKQEGKVICLAEC